MDATQNLSPEQARALIEQAERTAATTRSGASWPHIAGLLAMGAASSLAIPALAYVPTQYTLIPLILLFVWIGALFAFSGVFGRALKQGFGRRWTMTIALWGVLWAFGIFGIYLIFPGQTWFVIASSAALAIVTLAGAWIEARK